MSEMRILHAMGDIDEIFIAEVNEVETQKHRNYRLTTLIVIASLISILGMTGYAAEYVTPLDYWFYKFFSNDDSIASIDMLTENQQSNLEHGLVEINQSVTDNGITVTLESGLSDGIRAYLKFRIEATDGSILNADDYTLLTKTNFILPDGEDGNFSVSYRSSKMLYKEPIDSSIVMLEQYLFMPPSGTDFNLADGSVWNVNVEKILADYGHNENMRREVASGGNWNFSVRFSDDAIVTDTTELLKTPVRCSAKRSLGEKSFDIKVKVTSIQLRTLSATVIADKPLSGFWEGVLLDPIYLVLNDGTYVKAEYKMTSFRRNHMECMYIFDRPISIDDVAYIDLPRVGERRTDIAPRDSSGIPNHPVQAYHDAQGNIRYVEMDPENIAPYFEKHEPEYYAYMNLHEVEEKLIPVILQARYWLVFTESWVADSTNGAVLDENGVEIETVPHFHEIFPEDWEIPCFPPEYNEPDAGLPSTFVK